MNKGRVFNFSLALLVVAAVCFMGCESPSKIEPYAGPTMEPGAADVSAPPTTVEKGMVKVSYAFPTGDKSSSVIWIEKSAPAEIQVGHEFTYTIKAVNLANCDLDDVIITDRLAENFQMKSSTPLAESVKGDEARWALGTLGVEETKIITVTGVAKGTGALTGCAKVAYRTNLCMTVMAVEPKLDLSKSAPAEVLICDTIPLRYVVTNVGTGTAQNVKIMDTLPDGLVTTDGKKNVHFDVGDLAKAESREFSVQVNAQRTGKYASMASATAMGGLSAEASATTMVHQPKLEITKKAPKQLFIGRNFTYEITVTNKGDSPSKETVIQDYVPAGAKFISASHNGSLVQGVVTWHIGTLEPGASKTVLLTLFAEQIASVENTATVQGICADCVEAKTVTKLVGIPAILLEVVDLEDPVEVGKETTYVIMATNQGTADATNIRITCTLEDEVQYVSVTGPTTATVAGKVITLAPLSQLAPKAKASWNLTVKALKAADVRFKVSMESDQISRPVEETEATHLYE